MLVKTLVCLYLVVAVTAERDSLLIPTAQGPVRGYREPDVDLYGFYGIPYATAPTGPNKFQAPLPPPVWTEPLDTVDRGVVCPQARLRYISLEDKSIQDDCLIANVFVPDTNEMNLPVVVYVHGGACQVGYGEMVTPKSFINGRKIIGVTFNYRLGINGFLCLGTKGAPGNAGLKDQVALLRWVKENIANFGGNPDDVTIAGCSAGSVSVDILMISKATEGLFHKVIPESGASVGVIAIQNDPLSVAKRYARLLNFTDVDDLNALEEFYKNVPMDLLTKDTFFESHDTSFAFTPCVERDDIGEEVVLDDDPVNILATGNYRKVPVLYGFANMEGLLRLELFGVWKTKMNENFEEFLPADLGFESEEEKSKVAETVKEFYFGDKPVSEETILGYIDYFSDILFVYPMLRAVKLHVGAGHEQLYLYEYSFTHDQTPMVPFTDVRGAAHCSQTITVINSKRMIKPGSSASEELKKMEATMQELWHNFILTGNPVPDGSSLPAWLPVGADRSPHMSLGQTVELKGSLLERRARFWDDIYDRYYRAPVAPRTPITRTEL